MAAQQQHAPGGHYSGHNPIPTVRQFVDNLDKGKKERDRKLDEEAAQQKKTGQPSGQNATTAGGAQPHQMQKRNIDGTETTVTDPTTGNQVTISDVDKSMMSEVENPHLVIPNANLQKDTVRTLRRMLRLHAY
jgi:diaminopimelate epimerase